MQKGTRLWEQFSHVADLPDEVFPGQTLIEIVGDQRILIEHHKGVKEYGHERICVRVNFGILQIHGKSLHLRCMTRTQLVICGCIQDISLIRKEQL